MVSKEQKLTKDVLDSLRNLDGFSDYFLIKGFKRHLLQEVLRATVVDLDGATSEKIETKTFRPESNEKEHIRIFYSKYSAAGITLRFLKNGFLAIELNWSGSLGDVMLCYSFMDSIMAKMPHASIMHTDFEKVQDSSTYRIKLAEYKGYSMEEAWNRHLDHMAMLALSETLPVTYYDGTRDDRASTKGFELGLRGVRRDYYFSPDWIKEHWKDIPREEIAKRLITNFQNLQTLEGVIDCSTFKASDKENPQEEYRTRIIDNQADYFVAECARLMLVCGRTIHVIDTEMFLEIFKDSEAIERVDSKQFIIRKQSKEGWELFVSQLPQDVMKMDFEDKNFYVCKWDPQEHFSVQEYLNLKKTSPYLQFTMPFRDMDSVCEKDLALLVRIGSGNAGLIGLGIIDGLDNTQEEERVIVTFLQFSSLKDPYYPMEDLNVYLPTVDWESEETGIRLSKEQSTLFQFMYSMVAHKTEEPSIKK